MYTTPFAGQADARTKVRAERRLELAMEGQRFFDLRRWGIADATINAYLAVEKNRQTLPGGRGCIRGPSPLLPDPGNSDRIEQGVGLDHADAESGLVERTGTGTGNRERGHPRDVTEDLAFSS